MGHALLLCGLAVSVCAMTWFTGTSRTAAVWVFVGTGLLYIALRLLFGRGSGLEMFYLAHVFAILLLFLLPTLARAKEKARRLQEVRPNQSLQPTPVGVVSSADAGHVVAPAWLSFGR